MTGTVLQTERLMLVPPAFSHARDMTELANNKAISEMLATMPYPYGIEDAMHWIEAVREMTSGAAFSIILKDSSRFIGCCGSGPVENSKDIDFGYWIGAKYWGQGYATEAGRAVLSHVFDKDRFEIIVTDCKPTNAASLRVLEKLGFDRVGSRTRFCEAVGREMVTEKLQLRRIDWKTNKVLHL